MDYSAHDLARLNDNPLYRALGIEVTKVGSGSARAVLTPSVHACWPSPAQPHGGVLFTVMDTTMAFAALSHGEPDSSCATVDCSIQYLAPARDGPFVCQVATTRRAGRTVFVRAEILDANQGPVAMGQATFRLFTRAG